MSWKKIVALFVVLAALLAAILLVNRRESRRQEAEGRLATLDAARVARIEIVRGDSRFVFERSADRWQMKEPLVAPADRVAVNNILDEYCPLKYDRQVEAAPRDLSAYGLDRPQLELRLFTSGQQKPTAIVQLGIRNPLDDSSYARLGTGGAVVMVPAHRRTALEKEPFDFREKKFFELDTPRVDALAVRYEGSDFAFAKREGRWFMDKPLPSLAHPPRLDDILSRASALEAKAFLPADRRKELGLETPVLDIAFTVAGATRTLQVGRKGEALYAQAGGGAEIAEVDKSFLDSFFREAGEYRQRKAMPFYAFDVKAVDFKSPPLSFRLARGADNAWRIDRPAGAKKPDEGRVNDLLAALEGCEAQEFVDVPGSLPPFPTTIVVTADDLDRPGKQRTLTLQFSAPQGDSLLVRDTSLSYLLKVDKAIADKLPRKLEDLQAGPVVPAGKPAG